MNVVPSHPRNLVSAFAAGALIGTLGGLVGLGGAEFRLPLLMGKLRGLHSVSINMSHRITLELVIAGSEIVPINVGAHDEIHR